MKQEVKMGWDGISTPTENNQEEEAAELRLPHSSEEIEKLFAQLQSETIRDTFEKLAFDKPATAEGVRSEMPPEVRKEMIGVLLKVERLAGRMLDRTSSEQDPSVLADAQEIIELGLDSAIKEKRDNTREITHLPTEDAVKKQLAAWIDSPELQKHLPDPDQFLSRFGRVDFDVNGLKAVNDAWGHVAGDSYLQTFADFLRDNPAGRYFRDELNMEIIPFHRSGDEFGLIVKSNQHSLDSSMKFQIGERTYEGNILQAMTAAYQDHSQDVDIDSIDLADAAKREKLQQLLMSKNPNNGYVIKSEDKHLMSMSAGGVDAREMAYTMLEDPGSEFSREAFEKDSGGGWHKLSFGTQLVLGMSRLADSRAGENKPGNKKSIAEQSEYMKAIFSIR